MSFITVDQANAIIAGVVAKAKAAGMKPLTVAVVDAGGSLICFQRSDGAPPLRPAVAIGKAAARSASASPRAASARWRSSGRTSSAPSATWRRTG